MLRESRLVAPSFDSGLSATSDSWETSPVLVAPSDGAGVQGRTERRWQGPRHLKASGHPPSGFRFRIADTGKLAVEYLSLARASTVRECGVFGPVKSVGSVYVVARVRRPACGRASEMTDLRQARDECGLTLCGVALRRLLR